ncbi:MAG: hypothetical protein J6C87_07060 [Bacteroides sp.]|nr:hypothetical protein [Bacteroides sp.]
MKTSGRGLGIGDCILKMDASFPKINVGKWRIRGRFPKIDVGKWKMEGRFQKSNDEKWRAGVCFSFSKDGFLKKGAIFAVEINRKGVFYDLRTSIYAR